MINTVLRLLGISAWISCLLVLAYQTIIWTFSGTWNSITLLETVHDFLGYDLVSLIQSLPFEAAVKTTYILITTELSIALWWLEALLFGLILANNIIFGR